MSSLKRTGDIKGNTESLIRNLKLIKYPSQTNFKILSSGNPEIYLPIIHYSLFNFSPLVAKFLSDNHYDMYAKNDLDFMNTAFKCLISLFDYRPDINTNQFFSNGYAEGKVILCKEIIDIILQKHSDLSKKNKKFNNKFSKNTNKNDNNQNNNNINDNNNSPKFHELNTSKNSNKKSNNSSSKKNNYNDNELNNINNNFNASLPMNNIPVPTPKPQNLYGKYNNQNSVQSFKPRISNNNNMNQMDIYDSSQEYASEIQVYESSVNNNAPNPNVQNSTSTSLDFNSIVKIITSLSESVSQMVNKIEKFKENIENRLNKIEAEIVIIKNKQNYLESNLNNNNNNISNNNSNSFKNSNNDYIKDNRMINNNNIMNENNIEEKYKNQYYSNIQEKNNNQYSFNQENLSSKNNQIFTSFAPNISPNTGNSIEENNNLYYTQGVNNFNNKNNIQGHTPNFEESKVFNVFSYNQSNINNYNLNNLNNEKNDLKNKYADIDKLIQKSENNFFKTQKLLENYDNKGNKNII